VELVTENGWLLLGVLLIGVTVWVTLWLRHQWSRSARVRRAARAQRAERSAAGFLEASGFKVIGRQVRQSWTLRADGEEVRFTLIADYLVTRGGQRWVAEVKTGERSLDLRYGPTRRQLLEYREAFAVQGVLLVDAEGRTLRSVRFPEPQTRAAHALGIVKLGVGMVLGWALAAYWFS
jgi:hypothetical protein